MSKKMTVDRRVIRTKEAIRDALVELIAEKGFEAVSVSDVTDRANINRGTFYLHYRDKFDLLEQTETEIIDDLKEKVFEIPAFNVADVQNIDEPLPALIVLIDYIEEHADLLRAMMVFKGNVNFQSEIKKIIEMNLIRIGFFSGLKKEEDRSILSKYFISYIVSAHLGVLQEWLQGGCIESPKEMALLLSKLSIYGPAYAFGIRNSL